MVIINTVNIKLLKAFRIKFQKFAAHAQTVALINETFIPTRSLLSALSTELNFIFIMYVDIATGA